MGLDKDTLLLLKSAWLGDGEPDLGERLIKSFLTMLLESGTVPARIICINSGIFLSTDGSPVEDLLKQFVERGATVASCTTCLDYYKRRDKLVVGTATDMRDIVGAMLGHGKTLMP